MAFLRDLAEILAEECDPTSALERAIALITGRLGLEGAAIARCEPCEGRALCLLASAGMSPAEIHAWLATPSSVLDDARQRGEPTANVPPLLTQAAGPERALMLVPLRHAGSLVGAALFAGREIAPATREVLLTAARMIAVAVSALRESDTTTRLRTERRQLLDSLQSLVFRIDAETGETLSVNAAVERLLGVPAADLLGAPGLSGLLADEREREAMDGARAAVAAGGSSPWVERRFVHRDGRTRIFRTRLYRLGEAHAAGCGRAVIEGIAQDVTEEIEARKQLVQADRLASLGMLAAGVAHEINNPAAFISLGVQQLARVVAQLPEQPECMLVRRRMSEVIDELSEGIQRIVQIVGELKLFARIPEGSFSTPVDVNRLIASAVTLVRAELRHRARLEIDLGELPPLPGDHARLGQVFVNLLINAAQAIPPGDEEHNVVRVRTREEGSTVVVEVSDTGVGIAPEDLPRIFDPFFTTKAPGEGTGLGLAISYDLVRRAGGTIDVSSTLGRGTQFVVRLPVREFVPARGSRPRITPVPPGGRVLVIDDEQHLAVAIARALAVSYMVELAPDAQTALARIEGGGGREYDAVLCDLRLPGMDGRALYESVRARWPAQAERFVFLTGAGFDSDFEAFVRATDRPVLEKPFEMSDLEAVVAQVVHHGHTESLNSPDRL